MSRSVCVCVIKYTYTHITQLLDTCIHTPIHNTYVCVEDKCVSGSA